MGTIEDFVFPWNEFVELRHASDPLRMTHRNGGFRGAQLVGDKRGGEDRRHYREIELTCSGAAVKPSGRGLQNCVKEVSLASFRYILCFEKF